MTSAQVKEPKSLKGSTPESGCGCGVGCANKAATPDRVAKRAYELFLARRGTPGDPVADWLQAERELNAAATPPKKCCSGKGSHSHR